MWKKNRDAHNALKTNFKKVEDFQFNLKSKGFSKFIGKLRSF